MSPSVRRRRTVALVLVLVLAGAVIVLVVHAMGGTPGTRRETATGAPSPTVTPRRAPGRPPLRDLSVDRSEVDLVDTSRDVASGGVVLAAHRSLPTQVWAPTGAGSYPLVVFVHGYDKGPSDYARFCSTLASSGYVVAAPSFPLEDPAQGFPLDRTRLADEAGDVSFVVTSLEQRAETLDLAPDAVGVVGHSDGADVALLVVYGTGTIDPRVDAVVAVAPDPMPADPAPSAVPLLLVQGTDDSVVPYSSSQAVYGQVDAPVVYLSLVGADHLAPIVGGTPWTPVLDEGVARFLDATVARRGPGTGGLADRVADPPLATVESKA
jgi:dienelactone hydrolase